MASLMARIFTPEFRQRLRKLRRRVGQALTPAQLSPDDGFRPAGGRVLCLAPHPDDEVIGCGGALRRHALAGDTVSVVYFTRGHSSRGFPWLTAEQRGQVREGEARASCKLLGIAEPIFLEGREGNLQTPALVEALAGILRTGDPRVIYVPHPADNHEDHRAVYRTLVEAIAQCSAEPTDAVTRAAAKDQREVYGYEVWSPLPADFAVDITPYMRDKVRAIRQHRLALDAFNYVPTLQGLAVYRCGTLLQREGYAEAYQRLTATVAAGAAGASRELPGIQPETGDARH